VCVYTCHLWLVTTTPYSSSPLTQLKSCSYYSTTSCYLKSHSSVRRPLMQVIAKAACERVAAAAAAAAAAEAVVGEASEEQQQRHVSLLVPCAWLLYGTDECAWGELLCCCGCGHEWKRMPHHSFGVVPIVFKTLLT
jgi:hypothetical protein